MKPRNLTGDQYTLYRAMAYSRMNCQLHCDAAQTRRYPHLFDYHIQAAIREGAAIRFAYALERSIAP